MDQLSRYDDFARAWYGAWNAHDLQRIVGHYRHDIVFVSSFVGAVDDSTGDELRGISALIQYFDRALKLYPQLKFEPISVFDGPQSVVLHYRSIDGLLAAETMELDRDGLVTRALAHYHRPAATPRPRSASDLD